MSDDKMNWAQYSDPSNPPRMSDLLAGRRAAPTLAEEVAELRKTVEALRDEIRALRVAAPVPPWLPHPYAPWATPPQPWGQPLPGMEPWRIPQTMIFIHGK